MRRWSPARSVAVRVPHGASRIIEQLGVRVEILRLHWLKSCAGLCHPPVNDDLENIANLIRQLKEACHGEETEKPAEGSS
jgi:hypothetical protein